jgi:hypothetical protein
MTLVTGGDEALVPFLVTLTRKPFPEYKPNNATTAS